MQPYKKGDWVLPHRNIREKSKLVEQKCFEVDQVIPASRGVAEQLMLEIEDTSGHKSRAGADSSMVDLCEDYIIGKVLNKYR